MKNKEKFANEIFEIACMGTRIAVDEKTGNICPCSHMCCSDCIFCGHISCQPFIEEWMNSEYIETVIDWSKVPVDTRILVRDSVDQQWCKRYFAKYQDGVAYTWAFSATSWNSNNEITKWNYAKLAEKEESKDGKCEEM